MDSRRGEEISIPLLDNFCSREWKVRIRFYCPYIGKAVIVVGVYALLIWWTLVAASRDEHPIQPEIQLKSILVCPTNDESVIWDLKFDIINTLNDRDFCVFGFGVYVFLYNQTKLIAKTYADPVSPWEYIDPGNRASLIGLAEEEFSDYPKNNGTIRLDLKLHNHDYDLVCGDVKVELSSISNSYSSSLPPCGSMVGDPFACSYQPRDTNWLLTLLVVIVVFSATTVFFRIVCCF